MKAQKKPLNRGLEAKRLLAALKSVGTPETEIAFRTGASIHSVWRWRDGTRAPLPFYFNALKDFAHSKGIE